MFTAAKNCGVGIFTMNSLGGGVIPKLSLPERRKEESFAKKALAELYTHEEITTYLSSMQTVQELEENLSAFQAEYIPTLYNIRQNRLGSFCTKCRYCAGCPVGLPISDIKNLIMIIDCNGEGCTDFIQESIPLAPWREKLEAFGWEVQEVSDGHSIKELAAVFAYVEKEERTKPLCFLVNTIKGHGISFMEHVPWLHGQVPEGEDGVRALAELRGDLYAVE